VLWLGWDSWLLLGWGLNHFHKIDLLLSRPGPFPGAISFLSTINRTIVHKTLLRSKIFAILLEQITLCLESSSLLAELCWGGWSSYRDFLRFSLGFNRLGRCWL